MRGGETERDIDRRHRRQLLWWRAVACLAVATLIAVILWPKAPAEQPAQVVVGPPTAPATPTTPPAQAKPDPTSPKWLDKELLDHVLSWVKDHPEDYLVAIKMCEGAALCISDPALKSQAQGEVERLQQARKRAAENALANAKMTAREYAQDGDYDSAIELFDNVPEQFADLISKEVAAARASVVKEANEKVRAALAPAWRFYHANKPEDGLAALHQVGIIYAPMTAEVEKLRSRLLARKRKLDEDRRQQAIAAAEEKIEKLLDPVEAVVAKGDLAGAARLVQAALDDDALKPAEELLKSVVAACKLLPEVKAKPGGWKPNKQDEAAAAALLASAAKDTKGLAAALDAAKGHPLYQHYKLKLLVLKLKQSMAARPGRPALGLKGLILHYSFDRDEDGKVTDASPKKRHAKAVNLGWTAQGKVGGSAVFNGKTSYVDIGADHDLPQRDNYTISVWFLNDGKGDRGRGYGQKIFDKTIMYHDFYLRLHRDNGQLAFHTVEGSRGALSSGGLADGKKRDFRDGKWHHCAIIKKGANGRMYVDGKLVCQGDGLKKVKTTGPFLLGYSKSPDHYQRKYWSGMIDEFTVFDRPLAEEEVIVLWAAGAAELGHKP